MRRHKATLLVLIIPALIALGHDIYLYAMHAEKGFLLSDLGYIWTTYSPDSFAEYMSASNREAQLAAHSFESVSRLNALDRSLVQFLLEQKAVVVGLCYGLFLFVGMGIAFFLLRLIFGAGDESGGRLRRAGRMSSGPSGQSRDDLDFLSRNKKQRYEYKRK